MGVHNEGRRGQDWKYTLSEKLRHIRLLVWRCIDGFERDWGKISCLGKWDANHNYYVLPLPWSMHFDYLLHLLTLHSPQKRCLWSCLDSFTQDSNSHQFFSLYSALVFLIVFTENSAILYYMLICLSLCLYFLSFSGKQDLTVLFTARSQLAEQLLHTVWNNNVSNGIIIGCISKHRY